MTGGKPIGRPRSFPAKVSGFNTDPSRGRLDRDGAGRLGFGPEGDPGAEDQDDAANPEPHYEWVHKDEKLCDPAGIPAREHDVQIVDRRAEQADLRVRLGFEMHVKLARRL